MKTRMKTRMELTWVVSIAFAALLGGCGFTKYKNQPASGGGSDPAIRDENSLMSYSAINQAVLTPKCVGCHSEQGHNRGHLNLETYANVHSALDEIKARVSSQDPQEVMPPAKSPIKLSPSEAHALLRWIDLGGPEQPMPQPSTGPSAQPSPSASVEPSPALAPTYTSLKANVFSSRCIVCHAHSDPTRIPLTSLKEILDSTEHLVIPGHSSDSKLWGAVSDSAIHGKLPKHMPPKDHPEYRLSGEEIQTIQQWIDQGAAE